RLNEGRFDAIVLAAAGLRRLALLEAPHAFLPIDVCLPAVGQGTLAIEARVADEALCALLRPLEDRNARLQTEAERAFLKRLKGSCRVPIAGHAGLSDDDEKLSLDGLVASIDGERTLRAASERYFGEP